MTAAATPEGSGAMFDSIAERYDLLNRIISLGIDQRWRQKTVQALELRPGAKVLDLATGTCDLALLVARAESTSSVVGLDPSERMLDVGKKKITAAGLEDRVEVVQGDAQKLPFGDAAFDGVCIAFGIRNVPDRDRALREMARVTRPGGRIAILELSEPRRGFMAPFARFHIHTLVPYLGALLSGQKEYHYLQRSIAAFPPADEFGKQLQRAGHEVLAITKLTFGVCHLYVSTPEVTR